MASTDTDMKTAIETQDHSLGNEASLRSSGRLEGNEHGNDSNGVSDSELRPAGGEGAVDGVVLEQAIETLEAKKTTWWAYLATKEFWLVLLIG